MQLYDGPRQILAAAVASIAFLALFFGLTLVWWAALGGAVALYFAMLLIVQRKSTLDEIVLSARVSAADVEGAAALLEAARERLDRAATAAPEADRPALTEMARDIAAIRTAVLEDPADFRATRGFINVYLPKMVATVESYVTLAGRARGGAADRLDALGEQIRSYAPAIGRMRDACIENDLRALELEVGVLSDRLDRATGG